MKREDKVLEKYIDFLEYYFVSAKPELTFENEHYSNFLEVFYPLFSSHKYSCEDIFLITLNNFFNGMSKLPDNFQVSLDKLKDQVHRNFDANKDIHYILVPLRGSGLKEDIIFNNFYFLKEKQEVEYINQISEITSIKKEQVRDLITHTQVSRSPDFLKNNIVVIKVENQTSFVKLNSSRIADFTLCFLKLIFHSESMESSIFRMSLPFSKENKHVAILSNDHWRCGHGYSWKAYLDCKIDLDFMNDESYQNMFLELFQCFIYRENFDDLSYNFLNALVIFYDGLKVREKDNEDRMSLLMYITVAESLLAQKDKKKGRKLATFLSGFIKIDDLSVSEVSEKIYALYKRRNKFLHTGKPLFFSHEDQDLELFQIIIAKLLIMYPKIDSILPPDNAKSRGKRWDKFVNQTYNELSKK